MHELKAALATYTEGGGTGRTALDQHEAVAVMLEKYEVCRGLFGSFTSATGTVPGFDWAKWITGTSRERLSLLPAAQEHVLAKRAPAEARIEEELDHAVRQIISRAVSPEGVVDIFAAAGLEKPDISVLSDEFLADVREMPQRNLAVELLHKLLKGEVAARRRRNVVRARSFAEMLERTIRHCQNRAIEAARVIEELIQIAKDMRAAQARGESLGLSEDEAAFYDPLETNDSAVRVLGDETLRGIARAHLRVIVKRILRRHGYPPDKREKATQTVLEPAEVLSAEWAIA